MLETSANVKAEIDAVFQCDWGVGLMGAGLAGAGGTPRVTPILRRPRTQERRHGLTRKLVSSRGLGRRTHRKSTSN